MKRYALYATRYTLVLVTGFWLLVSAAGCDAFVRKFTRKPKGQKAKDQEMVIVPEEYKGPQMTREELYHQYFSFWQSWQNELIESFIQNRSYKKRVDCIQQAIKNLLALRPILNQAKQKELDAYLNKYKELESAISSDIYGTFNNRNRQTAERLKLDIYNNFLYPKVKDSLAV